MQNLSKTPLQCLLKGYTNKFRYKSIHRMNQIVSAGTQHVGAGKFRHPRRSSDPIYVGGGFFRSIYVDDGIFRHPHVVLLRYAWF
jgi:hypothetical protein